MHLYLAKANDFAFNGGRAGQLHWLAAHYRLNAGDQFARIEGFGQIIIGAHFQTNDAVDFVALGGEHDDRNGVFGGAQAAADGKTIFAGQHQIQHHEVEMFAVQGAIHHRAIRYGAHRKPLLAQIARKQVAQAGIVIDEQNFIARGGGRGSSGSGCHGSPSLLLDVGDKSCALRTCSA